MSRILPILAVFALWLATAGTAFAQAGGAGGQQVAGWMGYRNDSKAALVVQVTFTVNNQERRCPPHLMNPREVAADQVFGAGPKNITVFDPKSGKTLGRLTVPFNGKDLFFVVQVETGPNGMPTRAVVVPVPDPRTGGFPGAMNGVNPGAAPAMPASSPLAGLNPVVISGSPLIIPSASKVPGVAR